jgi:DNA polymerase V
VSPSLKAYGISGRARLFEVVQKVKEVNQARERSAPGHTFCGSSYLSGELDAHPEFSLTYIVAPPRMAYYMEYSTRIYNIYLKYIAPEDIHVYSIDEVFIDATHYLKIYDMTARQLASRMIQDIIVETGITATAGIGTNLYLSKVAMDILAKHATPDENGVRIAELDEMAYRRQLWNHQPLTDFWRVGLGYQKKLEQIGLHTMGDIALCSTGDSTDYYNEELLYKLFGVNAELLIDHAWGWEPTTIDLIKSYQPQSNSISSGQVLQCPYEFEKGKLIVREMTDLLVLDLVDKKLVTDQMVLTIGYDIENLTDATLRKSYRGEIKTDRYGRKIPKHAHGTANLGQNTSSTRLIMDAVMELYDQIVDPHLLIRRITVVANHLVSETAGTGPASYEQLDLFTDYDTRSQELEKERKLQEAMLSVKKKYGKNAILKGTNLQEGATTRDRNRQIGGHKA